MDGGKSADKWLRVTIGGASCALPVDDVVGVLSLRRSDISPVPFDTSGRIRGIFLYRGVVTPVLCDPALRADADAAGADVLTAVVLSHGDRRFALLVDDADAVRGEGTFTRLRAKALYTGEADDDD